MSELFDYRCDELNQTALTAGREAAKESFERDELPRQQADAAIIAYVENDHFVSPRDMEIDNHDLELAACPACRAKNVFLTHSVQNMDARKHVECRICCVQGPQRTSNDDAVKAWNDMPRNGGLEADPNGADLTVSIPPGYEFSMVQVGAIRKVRIYKP